MDKLKSHLDGQQPGQVDLCDSFGHGLVLHAASLRLHLIDFIRRPHQVEGVVVLQQSVFCQKEVDLRDHHSF